MCRRISNWPLQTYKNIYEGAGEVNKRVAWATANIDNTHFTTEHTYLFEKLSAVLQVAVTILNTNGEIHSDNNWSEEF